MRHRFPAAWCAAACLLVPLMLGGCAGPYTIGYARDPLEGPPSKFSYPILVRPFSDLRPHGERVDTREANTYAFWSCDKMFTEDVDAAITKALQLELANAGIEVADEGNHIIGKKPHLRLRGDVCHFQVTRATLPVSTLQEKTDTLWQRGQYNVRIGIRITVIDTDGEKLSMRRMYTSSDSFAQRTGMTDVKNPNEAQWKEAGDAYCIQLLNEHLKRIMVQVRKDIIKLVSPEEHEPGLPSVPDLTEPEPEPTPEPEASKPDLLLAPEDKK